MDRVKPYNIMLAFASFVSSIEELKYRSSDGTKIFEKCVQSNEPAICEMQDRLHDTGGARPHHSRGKRFGKQAGAPE